MKAAVRAGCYPLGIRGGFDADELKAAGARDCLDSVAELPPWWQEHSAAAGVE